MARLARVVAAGVPHHVTQRGNRRQQTFFCDSDYETYRTLLAESCAAADVSVTNDSGLMHISAAIGTPTVAIFGPTSPWHWKPLNPVAAILEPTSDEASRLRARTQGNDAVAHHRTDDVAVETVLSAVRNVLDQRKSR